MKTILYTGARGGIAEKVIEKIKNDYFIYLTVYTNKQLKYVKEKYKNNLNINCFKLDITNKNDLKQLEDLDIDILINNAAIGIGGSISEIDINKVRENYEVNVFSSFQIVQIVLKKMLKKKKGKIIIMGSLASIFPINFLGVYCSTKASIKMLTKTLKNEVKLINKDIKIVLIEPGMYFTGFNEYMFENKYDWMEKKSYFKNQLNYIRKKEYLILKILEKRSLNSIVNVIIKAINLKNPHFIYKKPMLQVIGSKIYQIFG